MCTITELVHLSLLFLLTCLLRIVLVFSDSQQLMDMIELLAGSVGIEAIVTNVAEMRIRNMDDQFLDEFNGRLDDIITFFILVIMIVPMNNIGLLIVTDDAAFSDARPAGITHIVGDARIDVIAMIFVFKFFIFFLGPGMDVKSFRMIFIQDRFSALERRADFFFDEAKQFVLEGLSQFGEIEMGEELEGIFIRGIDQFRNEGMDMRIPFEITAKGMEGGDHAKMIDMAVVLEGIVRELDAFSPELADEGSIDKSRNGIASSDEEDIEVGPVLAEPVSEAVRDGEDDMSVFGIEAERGGLDRKLFGIFDAAGITETRMAVSVDGSKVITMRVLALKIIAAEINGIAKERTLNIVEDTGAGTARGIPTLDDVVIMEEDGFDGMMDIKIDKIEVMRILEFKNRRVNRSIDHE